MLSIALLSLAIVLLVAFRRITRPRPPQPRHVSFESDASLHKRRSSAPPRLRARRPPPPPAPPKPPARVSPLRLSFSRRKTSFTSTLLHIDNGLSSPPSTSPLPQRTRSINPFGKYFRSRALSSSSTLSSPDTSSSGITSPLPPHTARRTLASKFKSMFKSTPSSTAPPKLLVKSINAKLRRKPVARTQPYGPPWNAPMPVPDFSLSQHFLDDPPQTSSTPGTSWKRTTSLFEETTMSSTRSSSHKFINELDEKLLLLQQQRVQRLTSSHHV